MLNHYFSIVLHARITELTSQKYWVTGLERIIPISWNSCIVCISVYEHFLRVHRQFSLQILSEFKRIIIFYSPNISKNFRGSNRSYLIRSSSLNITSKTSQQSLRLMSDLYEWVFYMLVSTECFIYLFQPKILWFAKQSYSIITT